MPNLKRLKKKREKRKKALYRQIAVQNQTRELLGTHKMEDRMIYGHQDVLQNIEFALISGYRNDNAIDDSAIADALKAAILSLEPGNERSASLVDGLAGIRHMRADIDDDLWRDGLRTVLRSVRRHSDLQPGSRDYIHFVSPFVI